MLDLLAPHFRCWKSANRATVAPTYTATFSRLTVTDDTEERIGHRGPRSTPAAEADDNTTCSQTCLAARLEGPVVWARCVRDSHVVEAENNFHRSNADQTASICPDSWNRRYTRRKHAQVQACSLLISQHCRNASNAIESFQWRDLVPSCGSIAPASRAETGMSTKLLAYSQAT